MAAAAVTVPEADLPASRCCRPAGLACAAPLAAYGRRRGVRGTFPAMNQSGPALRPARQYTLKGDRDTLLAKLAGRLLLPSSGALSPSRRPPARDKLPSPGTRFSWKALARVQVEGQPVARLSCSNRKRGEMVADFAPALVARRCCSVRDAHTGPPLALR